MSQRVQSFLNFLTPILRPRSRILEIGAGEGELARALSDAGHTVVAIDPAARGTFPVLAIDFENYDATRKRFDCVIAMLVLHHIHDLEGALRKVRSLLELEGCVAIDDYGWERMDDAAARCAWGRAWKNEMRTWLADRADLHRSDVMLPALDRHFLRAAYRDHAYFEDGRGGDALGFSYIGGLARRSDL